MDIFPDIEVSKNSILCVIGDETGIVWAELPQHNPDVKSNVVLHLNEVETDVHEKESKLIVRLTANSILQRTSMRMPNINIDVDMS